MTTVCFFPNIYPPANGFSSTQIYLEYLTMRLVGAGIRHMGPTHMTRVLHLLPPQWFALNVGTSTLFALDKLGIILTSAGILNIPLCAHVILLDLARSNIKRTKIITPVSESL
jgi:hypothetical protein